MPKKSKKSRRPTDPNLPDLATRRANLLAMGMASPYQGDTTSSSSFDDSSSSTTTTNEIEESGDNTARLQIAAEGSSAIAHHSADGGKHSAREDELPILTITLSDTEPETDSEKIIGEQTSSVLKDSAREDESTILTITLSDTEPETDSEKWVGISGEKTSSVLQEDPESGNIPEAGNASITTASVSTDQSYQNLRRNVDTECSKASSIISLEQPPEKNACKDMSCMIQASENPKFSESIECAEDDQKLSDTTICRIPVEAGKREVESTDDLLKNHPDGGADTQKEANREDEKNKTLNEDFENPECCSHETYSKQEPSAKHTTGKAEMVKVVTLEKKTRTIAPTNRLLDATPKEKIVKIKAPTKCITVASLEEREKSVTPPPQEISSKECSKRVTPTKRSAKFSSKERSKSVTPTKRSMEVSSKERSKRMTPTKTEVPSKDRSKSLTPTKRSKKISFKEKAKRLTPTKYTTEVSSKEKAKSIMPANVCPEASLEKYEKTLSPVKYSSGVPLEENMKSAKTKPTLETEKSEKTVRSTKDMIEIPPKEKTKTVTPTEYIPEVLSKEKLKLTSTKRTREVPSKERTRTPKPAKQKLDASSQEDCEKTLTPTCTPEAPLKEKTETVTPIKRTSKDASKERSKTLTPTKRMPEASSNENRARSVTPSKRTPEGLSKEETKCERKLKRKSVALPRKKFEVTAQTQCTPESSTGSGELKPNTPAKITMAASSKAKKPLASTRNIEETSCRERIVKPATPTKCTKGYTESPIKHSRDREREYETQVKSTLPHMHGLSEDVNESNDPDCTEQNIISFKDFKEALGVDRVPSPDINFDEFDKAISKDSENSSRNKSPEPKQEPDDDEITTEEFLDVIAMVINNFKLKLLSINEKKTETRIEPTSAREPRVPRLTIEEFRRALGTDRITPARTDDDLDVFNKALEKLEAKRSRRVTFLVPNDPVPSTSRAKTSPERQLDNKVSQKKGPDSRRNRTLSGGTLTFEEFHRGLRTFGYLKPELLNLDVFDKALDEMERTNSSQLAQEVHKDSCRPDPLEESDKSNSSDDDINKAIAASGIKTKRFRVASSDDEQKNSQKCDPSKMSDQLFEKIGETKLRAPRITDQILEEDSYLSESTSKSSEASLEESSGKSSEPDLVSSESVVKSSESETSPMECVEKSLEEDLESSESAVKSTESEPSPDEYIGVFKESTELCEIETGRGESSGTSEDSELKSPKKRRRSERIIALQEKSVDKKQRSRTQSESDLGKRPPGEKHSKPKKKRYSDEH